MIGQTLWDEFFANRDWPVASAVAIVLLVIAGRADPALSAPRRRAALERRMMRTLQRRSTSSRSRSGFAFLYLPIACW